MTAAAWAAEGEAWTRWARGPARERYVPFSEALFAVLPEPSGPAVDLGCGAAGLTVEALAELPFPPPLNRLPLALAIRAGKPG